MKNLTRHLLLFALLIFSDIHILLAQSYILPFEASEFESIGTDAVNDPELYELDGTPVLSSSSPTAIQVGNIKGLIVLYIDPMNSTTLTEALDMDVSVRVSYKLFPYEGASHEETIQLNVNYDPDAGTTYKTRDYHLIENAGWIQIEEFGFDLNGYADPIGSLGGAIKLQLEIISDKYYLPVRTQRPEMQSTEVDRNDGYVRFKWKPLGWAKYYDVEWTYVDNYGETSGSEINSLSLSYDFKNNSTRLRIADNHVEIPIIYEKGFIVFRARGVGVWDKDIKQTIEGLWTLEDEGTGIVPVSFGIFKIDDSHAHEKDRMNWKHTVQYDDDGNRKDVVEYLDGSLRTRQSVSQINSEDMLIVGETLYDHQGRPAISVLPAPYKPPVKPMDLANYINAGDIQAYNFGDRVVEENLKRSRITDFLNNSSIGGSAPSGGTPPPGSGTGPTPGGTPELPGLSYDFSNPDIMIPERISEGLREDMLDGIPLPGQIYNTSRPKISYQPNFNLNIARRPYDRRNFDLESPEDCETAAEPMDTWRGASNYYSPYNPDKSTFNAYIPDAQRYPFTHLQYTPDKTGRVRKQGGLGPDFKIGSGHEQKLFYAVPSQFELDRLFGTDVGYAQHYKKQISIDPNGQASLSFTDLRGNTIATALTGPSPKNMEQIDEYEELNITLDLLSDKSVLPEGSYNVDNRSIETSKTLYLSRPTEVSLNYRLLSQSYVDDTCPSDICYECAYDLEVYIVDDCGETKYRLTQTIDSLIGTNSCNPVSFDQGGSVTLDAGMYTVVRKLSVSAEAIAQRLALFRGNSSCLLPLRAELPTDDTPACDPPCNVCEYSTVDVEVFVAPIPGVTRPRSLILPVEFVNGGSADCRTFCPGESISEIGSIRMMMLNDVSPMGQYALYVESPRIHPDPSPLGHVDPDAFPLSVLNVSNRLPIRNANWKNPAIPYRDTDGNDSFIPLNDDMLPAHSPEHRELIGGNYYVRPQYLDDVEDFINNWKTSWAESLIIYHPEYQHYLWMRDHRADYEQNTLMQQIETYDEASVITPLDGGNYINHISRAYGNDRFISRNRAIAEPIANSIFLNYTPFTDGRVLNLDETIFMIVNCNNVNFTHNQLYDCANDRPLYTNIGRRDIEWKYYRDLYLAGKKRVMDEVRELALALGYINHNIIGREGSPYHDKQKRIMSSGDLLDILADDIEYADPSALLSSLAVRANQEMLNRCGICPLGSQFLALLNGFAHEGKLLETVRLPDAPPLVLTRDLVDAFTVKTAEYYQWVPRADRDVLTVSFQTGGSGDVCSFSLTKTDPTVEWNEIKMFTCITPGNGTINIQGVTENRDLVNFTFNSSCLNVTDCERPTVCSANQSGRDMRTFLDHLFRTNLYTSSSSLVHTKDASLGIDRLFISQYFSDELAAIHPIGLNWTWQFQRYVNDPGMPPNKKFEANLNIAIDPGRRTTSGVPYSCRFRFRILDPAYSFDQIDRISRMEVYEGSDWVNTGITGPGDHKSFRLTAETNTGEEFEILGASSCYQIGECCAAGRCNSVSCCLPLSPMVPALSQCVEGFLALDRANTEREWISRMEAEENAFISAYIRHCLASAENLMLEYEDAQYHFTLFYYDQFNNLIKTVPPKGVTPLGAGALAAVDRIRRSGSGSAPSPAHRLATTMRYNTLNEMVEKTTPDGGTTRYCYDEVGRIILSQTAVQAESSSFSYIIYDAIGRIIETGETRRTRGSIPEKLDYATYLSTWMSGAKKEIFITHYDEPISPDIETRFGEGQKNLRNRISSITYQEDGGREYDHAIHYGYDILGNVKEVVQEFPLLARQYPMVSSLGQHIKKIKYDFDLISGKTNKVIYQPGEADQFIHWFDYDAEYRIRSVKTGTIDEKGLLIGDNDANYFYYKHGPLARLEIGEEKVQGLDYAYTINGWLKGVNSGTLDPGRDMGNDGMSDGDLLHGRFARDAIGFTNHYFDGDYSSIERFADDTQNFITAYSGSALRPNLWNGNIDFIASSIDGLGTFQNKANVYTYDQLNRITGAASFVKDAGALNSSNSWSGGGFNDRFNSSYTYDPNGNILSLMRKDGRGTTFDQLNFNLSTTSNQLTHIVDRTAAGVADNDLDSQGANNYLYDRTGRLLSDNSAGISRINWRHDDKVKSVQYAGGEVRYMYDANGRRILKITPDKVTYFVRDVTGNVLAVYDIDDEVTLNSIPVYGAARLGIQRVNQTITDLQSNNHIVKYRGKKRYELTGHTGNVERLVSDRKVPITTDESGEYGADGLVAMDYYPFGMLKDTGTPDTTGYLFGFQGQEKDNEIKGDGNAHYTEFRMYDPRAGRWLSLDKVVKYHESPYVAYGDNPINLIDPEGLDPIGLTQEHWDQAKMEEEENYMSELESQGTLTFTSAESFDREISRRMEEKYYVLNEQPQEQLAENQNRRRSRVTSNESNSSNSLTTSVVESSVELVSDASSAIANNEAINTYDFGSSSLDVVNISLTEGLAIYAEGAPVREILERNEARAQRAGRPRTAGRIRATGQRRVADFRARNPRPTLSVTRVLKSSVAGNAGPLAVVGGVISTAGMLDRFWHDANAVDRGDISGWRYGYRSVGNVAGGVIGVVIPFGDSGTYGLFDGYEEVFFDTPRLDQP